MKKYRLLTIVLSGIVLMTGCVEVTFPEPMPFNRRDRPYFPKSTKGVWYEKTSNDNLKDSIIIYSEFIDFGEEPLMLGSNTVLRKFNSYFVLSSKNEDGRWVVYLAKCNDETLSLYEFDGGDKEKVAIWEGVLFGAGVEKFQRENSDKLKEIKLKPSNNKEFREIINKGGLSHMGDYVR